MKQSSQSSENEEQLPILTAESLIKGSASRFLNLKEWGLLAIGTVLYFSWFYFFVGFRAEHAQTYVLLLLLYFSHSKTRQFLWAFFVFEIYWIAYDSLRIIPNYTVNTVSIAELYNFEKSIFGLNTEGGVLTFNEYFKQNPIPFWDVASGFFYINWVPMPMAFGFYLFLTHKRLFLKFAYLFFYTNLLGFVVYYAYPAAPPWYVEQHGFQLLNNIPSNAAGLIHFDKFFNIQFFQNLYQKNSNVFAAMPSMHSAFPMLCFLTSLKLRKIWLSAFFAIFVLGIWFSAIYTRHHYATDVLAGGTIAIISFFSFEYLSEKTKIKNYFDFLLTKF